MDGVLWDVGFGVGWPQNGDMGHRDEWGPMGSGIWGRVAQTWIYRTPWIYRMGEYGAQGLMGPYGIGDLGSNGPKVDIWDRDGRTWGSGINGVLWDVGFGVGWPKRGYMGLG